LSTVYDWLIYLQLHSISGGQILLELGFLKYESFKAKGTYLFHPFILNIPIQLKVNGTVEQSPSWEAKLHSTCQQTSAFYGPQISLPSPQEPTTGQGRGPV